MPHVSIIIPNYNGQRLLERHLPSVFEMIQSGDEVCIVDDASTDTSVAWLTERFGLNKSEKRKDLHGSFEVWRGTYVLPNAKKVFLCLIPNPKNLRFAANCNRGVRVAQFELIFLLNSDVRPYADALSYLLPHFEDSKVFAVGCLEQEPGQDKETIWGGKNVLWFEKGLFVHSRASSFESGETAWVSGGSGVFDKEKWLQLGGFNEEFAPAYWEDIDLSFRARKKDWKVLFESRAKVDHNHESTNSDVFGKRKMQKMSWRNADKFVEKNGTFWQRRLHTFWKLYWWWKRFRAVAK
jgi:GT2 family glycosyltransferase